jgi:hypothetical protein
MADIFNDYNKIIISDNPKSNINSEEIYREFSKNLLAALYRTYATYVENYNYSDPEMEIKHQVVANYFNYLKAVIGKCPDLNV